MEINERVFEKLSFPLRFFKNLTVGDYACGTGEYYMLTAKNIAKFRVSILIKNLSILLKKLQKNIK